MIYSGRYFTVKQGYFINDLMEQKLNITILNLCSFGDI